MIDTQKEGSQGHSRNDWKSPNISCLTEPTPQSSAVMKGAGWIKVFLIEFVLVARGELDISIGSKARHDSPKTSKGMYKTKEEVERPPTWDHPCNLTRTAVKISFPEEMRSEIFVNLLGYKEPNLLHLQR